MIEFQIHSIPFDGSKRVLPVYGIFGIDVAFSRSVQSGFYFHPCDEDLSQGTPERKKPLEGRAFGLQ